MAVVAVVVNALRMLTKQRLQSAMSRATMAARKAVQRDAMVALSVIVALMKTATRPRLNKTLKPLSV